VVKPVPTFLLPPEDVNAWRSSGAEVTWELPEGPFTWFRCRITSAVVDGSAEA